MILKNKIYYTFTFAFVFLFNLNGHSQAEFTTWGNLTGIRVDNQLMEFNSSLAVENRFGDTWRTRKEGQQIDFQRKNGKKVFSYKMGDLQWTQAISSTKKGAAEVEISFSSPKDTVINGAYFSIALPEEFGEDTKFSFSTPEQLKWSEMNSQTSSGNFKAVIDGVMVSSPTRSLEVDFSKPAEMILQKEKNGNLRMDVVLASGEVKAEKTYSNSFKIKAEGQIDNSAVSIKVFPEQEGDVFDGIGGNFRLQNPKIDPQVIDYNLNNLRVAWSRVELPWRAWKPNENEDPVAKARRGDLDPKVKAAMEMAQRLDRQGIPVMLAAWFPPEWAIIGKPFKGKRPDGSMGNSLDQSKKEEIYKSLTSYIKYLKDEYGVEAAMFSFNESDLGIDVHQSAVEHNKLIKELGQKFEAAGLKTKFLLGDTADANGWDFTTLASTDPEARPYIGGVSFHSWRGYTPENLLKWADISNRVGVPLFVGEGSIDAGAWRYPQIFEEPTYALDEIAVYLDMLRIAHPKSILQWQLTSDYSVLSGGGVFDNSAEKLHPTQRFYNLQQLGSTPKEIKAIPVVSENEAVVTAAFGDAKKGNYAIHLVNKGASRPVKIEGLPKSINSLKVYITNSDLHYKELEQIPVDNGTVVMDLKGATFTSLMAD